MILGVFILAAPLVLSLNPPFSGKKRRISRLGARTDPVSLANARVAITRSCSQHRRVSIARPGFSSHCTSSVGDWPWGTGLRNNKGLGRKSSRTKKPDMTFQLTRLDQPGLECHAHASCTCATTCLLASGGIPREAHLYQRHTCNNGNSERSPD